MNILQMAWRSVIRKPVKSILLFFVVLIISSFLVSGMASENASVRTQDKTRQAVGAGFVLEGNEADRSKRIQEISRRIGEDKEGELEGVHQKKLETEWGTNWQVWTDNSFETLRTKDIEKIAGVPGIEDYNITTSSMAVNPVNFARIEETDVDQSGDVLGVCLVGNRDMALDLNVLSGNLTIKEGRMVQKTDLNVCVISEELAWKNQLKVGDKLQFNDYHDRENAKVHEAEIIGIYKVAQKMSPYMSGDTYRSENVIFTDLRFPEKAEGSEGDPLFAKAYFKVGDVKKYESVKESIKKVDIDWERYDLIDNNGNLDTMSSNFNELQSMSRILIWVVAGASFVILFLVFVFWMKSRVQEIGILLALGTSKVKILGQILLEAVMIAVIAVSASFVAAPVLSEVTANYLVEQQVEQKKEQELSDGDKVVKPFEESEQTVTGVEVDITFPMVLFDSAGVLALIVTAVGTAGMMVVRRNPKDIFSEMS